MRLQKLEEERLQQRKQAEEQRRKELVRNLFEPTHEKWDLSIVQFVAIQMSQLV